MDRIAVLKAKVDALYREARPERAAWADWLFAHHVYLVAEEAARLARRFGAREDVAYAAGMHHDVADAVMNRFLPEHGSESEHIAREFLTESGFTDDEIHTIVEDALRYHGCHDGEVPQTLEGKVMAAADAVVHLTSDYYANRFPVYAAERGTDEARAWVTKKIERDFHDKILFPEVQAEVRQRYEALKSHGSR